MLMVKAIKSTLILLLVSNAAQGAPPMKTSETLTTSDLCRRFAVESEVYIYDASGEKLLNMMSERRISSFRNIAEANTKGCKLEHSWSSRSGMFGGALYVEQRWTIDPQGRIDATLSQWEILGTKSHERRKVKEETIRIKDMQPVLWRSVVHKDPVVVVRWTPRLRTDETYKDLSKIPLVAEDMVIYDNFGKIWAHNLNFVGIYTGVTTINGTLLLSFYPFQGAKQLGTAGNNQAKLQLTDKLSITLRSQEALLPPGIEAPVYGLYESKRRSESLDSQTIFNRSNEQEFLERHRES